MQSGFWWVLLALAIYGSIHSILAAHRTKDSFKTWWGETRYHRFYRLFFSIQSAVLFVPVLVLVVILPDQVIYRIPTPWVYLTTLIQGLSVIGIVHTIMLTGMLRFTGVSQALDPDQATKPVALVNRSLYRWVRHPIYSCMFLLVWLVPVMSWNLLALSIGISVYNVLGAKLEERKLVQEFGKDYVEYRKSTPFIIPGVQLKKR